MENVLNAGQDPQERPDPYGPTYREWLRSEEEAAVDYEHQLEAMEAEDEITL